MKEGERKKTWRNLAFRAVAALGIAVGGAIIFSSEVQAQEDEPQGTVCTMEIKGLGQNPRILTTCRTGEGNQQKVNDRVKLDGMCVAERTGNPPHPYILSMPKVDSLSIQKGLVILPGQHSAGPVENYPEVFAACANDPMSGLPVQVEVVGEGFLGQPEGAGPTAGESEIPASEPGVSTTTPTIRKVKVSCTGEIITGAQVMITTCSAPENSDISAARARWLKLIRKSSPKGWVLNPDLDKSSIGQNPRQRAEEFKSVLPLTKRGSEWQVVVGDFANPDTPYTVHMKDLVCAQGEAMRDPKHEPVDSHILSIDGVQEQIDCSGWQPGTFTLDKEVNAGWLAELKKKHPDWPGYTAGITAIIGLLSLVRKLWKAQLKDYEITRAETDHYINGVNERIGQIARSSSQAVYAGTDEQARKLDRVLRGEVRSGHEETGRHWTVARFVSFLFSNVPPESLPDDTIRGAAQIEDYYAGNFEGYGLLDTSGGHRERGPDKYTRNNLRSWQEDDRFRRELREAQLRKKR